MRKNFAPAIAAIILLTGIYGAASFGLVVRLYGTGNSKATTSYPGYRSLPLHDFFAPVHYLDRKFRRSYWREEHQREPLPSPDWERIKRDQDRGEAVRFRLP